MAASFSLRAASGSSWSGCRLAWKTVLCELLQVGLAAKTLAIVVYNSQVLELEGHAHDGTDKPGTGLTF